MCGMSEAADRKLMQEYRAEDDIRTLERAHEIQSDRGRMSGCRKLAKKRSTTYRKLLSARGRGGRR